MTEENLYAAVNTESLDVDEAVDAADGSDDGGRFVPIGSGELVQLLGTGILRAPDPSWNPFPPSEGVSLHSVSKTELATRIREIRLPRGRSALVILERKASAKQISECGLSLNEIAAIHVPDKKSWLKQEARFLQGDGWTLAGLDVLTTPELFETKPAEMELEATGENVVVVQKLSAIDRWMGGLAALLLADGLNIELGEIPACRDTFEAMCDIAEQIIVDLLDLDEHSSKRLNALVHVLIEEPQPSAAARIDRYFYRLAETEPEKTIDQAKKWMLDVIEAKETQHWSKLTDDRDIVSRALLCASLEPDVSKLVAYLAAKDSERPGNKVAAIALFITGTLAGVAGVPKQRLPNEGISFRPLAEIGLRCIETEPDEVRDEIIKQACRIMDSKPDKIQPRGFSLYRNGIQYQADIRRGGPIPRLVISAKLTSKRKLPQSISSVVLYEVAPYVNSRVMGDPDDPKSLRFESGLIVGNIDDPELAAAYQDIDEAIERCRSKNPGRFPSKV